jgi:hypothetical protein
MASCLWRLIIIATVIENYRPRTLCRPLEIVRSGKRTFCKVPWRPVLVGLHRIVECRLAAGRSVGLESIEISQDRYLTFTPFWWLLIRYSLDCSFLNDDTQKNMSALWCAVRFMFVMLSYGGGTVVKVLRYKSEGRSFDSRWCHWNFSST